MKRILVISTRIPAPLIDGMRIRISNAAKHLAADAEVDLFCISTFAPEPGAMERLNATFSRVFVRRINPLVSALLAGLSVLTGRPLQVHYFYRRRIRKEIEALLGEYDVVLCNHIRATEYFRTNKQHVVVDLHDSLAMHYERAIPLVGLFTRLIYRFEFPRVLRYELKVVAEYARTILVSEIDRQYLIERGASPESLVTINVAVRDDIDVAGDVPEHRSICFLGKMSYHPNVDSVEWFAREIFPRIREKHPDVYFYIIGATPSPRVQRLAAEPNIVVTGFVENPFSLVNGSAFMVAPIRVGAGLQNKVLEAMSIGKAVITTTLGAEGIDGADETHFLIADTPDAFVAQTERLLADSALAERIGEHAQALIDERYRWSGIGLQFREVVRKAAG